MLSQVKQRLLHRTFLLGHIVDSPPVISSLAQFSSKKKATDDEDTKDSPEVSAGGVSQPMKQLISPASADVISKLKLLTKKGSSNEEQIVKEVMDNKGLTRTITFKAARKPKAFKEAIEMRSSELGNELFEAATKVASRAGASKEQVQEDLFQKLEETFSSAKNGQKRQQKKKRNQLETEGKEADDFIASMKDLGAPSGQILPDFSKDPLSKAFDADRQKRKRSKKKSQLKPEEKEADDFISSMKDLGAPSGPKLPDFSEGPSPKAFNAKGRERKYSEKGRHSEPKDKEMDDFFANKRDSHASSSQKTDSFAEDSLSKAFDAFRMPKQRLSDTTEGFSQRKKIIFSFTDFEKFLKSEPGLGVFSQNVATSGPTLQMWSALEESELLRQTRFEPLNWFDQCIQWTEEGKLWKFPINNEQGMEEEAQVDFTEHIFLDRHIESWCPKEGPIKYFMELVLVGLSKNPYMSVREKVETLEWYQQYFMKNRSLLEEIDAFGSPQNPITVDGKLSEAQ